MIVLSFEVFQDLSYSLWWAMLTARFKFSVFKDINGEEEESRRRTIESEIVSGAHSIARPRKEGEVR